jgi:hypothetical protein
VQITADAGRTPYAAFVVQTHAPGGEAEVGFGEVWVELADEKTKCRVPAVLLGQGSIGSLRRTPIPVFEVLPDERGPLRAQLGAP